MIQPINNIPESQSIEDYEDFLTYWALAKDARNTATLVEKIERIADELKDEIEGQVDEEVVRLLDRSWRSLINSIANRAKRKGLAESHYIKDKERWPQRLVFRRFFETIEKKQERSFEIEAVKVAKILHRRTDQEYEKKAVLVNRESKNVKGGELLVIAKPDVLTYAGIVVVKPRSRAPIASGFGIEIPKANDDDCRRFQLVISLVQKSPEQTQYCVVILRRLSRGVYEVELACRRSFREFLDPYYNISSYQFRLE